MKYSSEYKISTSRQMRKRNLVIGKWFVTYSNISPLKETSILTNTDYTNTVRYTETATGPQGFPPLINIMVHPIMLGLSAIPLQRRSQPLCMSYTQTRNGV